MTNEEINIICKEIYDMEKEIDRLNLIRKALISGVERELKKRDTPSITTEDAVASYVPPIHYDFVDAAKVREYISKVDDKIREGLKKDLMSVGTIPGGVVVRIKGK